MQATPTLRKVPVFPLAIGLVVALFVVAFVMTRSPETVTDDKTVSETGATTVSGASLPLHEPSGEDDAVGLLAPSISGEDFAGRDVVVAHDGRAKLLIFLAHWCPHCRAEVPVVQEWLNRTGGPEDVDIYSISTGVDEGQPNYPPSAWLEREGWTVPVIRDDESGSAAVAYGLDGFPYFVFVTPDGTVSRRASGELTIEAIEAALREL